MITKKTGSILNDPEAELIVIPVSADGLMLTGSAAEAKKKYPDAARLFQNACAQNELKVGDVGYAAKQGNGKTRWLCWLVVRAAERDDTRLADLEKGFETLSRFFDKFLFASVALPVILPGPSQKLYDAFAESCKSQDISLSLYE